MKKKLNVGIIGLGYVGLPLLLLINKKFNVFGFDKDIGRINLLKKGISYNSDIKNSELKRLRSNTFYSNINYNKISICDYIII